MLSTSAYPRSADAAGSVHAAGLRWFPYGLQDASDLGCFVDEQPYDLRFSFTHPAAIDPQLLLLNNPPMLGSAHLGCRSEVVSFGSNHNLGWSQEPYCGEFTMPEMMVSAAIGGDEVFPSTHIARSCSPASDMSMLSDGGSSDFSVGLSLGSLSSSGPSGSLLVPGTSAAGPVRRGRGRPRKDAPPVYQPPPVCTYVDPLTNTPCGKLLNRHHDLPRHMVKHCQEEAALVRSGRLPRERAVLLPPDWQQTDELKLPCRFCSATFSRADAVTRHEKREHRHRPRKG